MEFAISDDLLGTFVPIVVYWLYSGLYVFLGSFDKLENYRLHSRKDEDEKNLVSKSTVVKGVLLQQVLQAIVSILLFIGIFGLSLFGIIACSQPCVILLSVFMLTWTLFTLFLFLFGDRNDAGAANQRSSLIVLARQFVIAMFVMDTWQYFIHRYMHQNKFLYRHIHSLHHRLVVPYAFGALYNHPIEGLLLDTVGGALSFLLSGMSPRASIFFFSFATIKTVDDHCGLWLPGNLFQVFFKNNTAYHDVHHQLYGSKYNFAQPFFVIWDRILGTYMPYSLEKRAGGGFEAQPTKDYKDN